LRATQAETADTEIRLMRETLTIVVAVLLASISVQICLADDTQQKSSAQVISATKPSLIPPPRREIPGRRLEIAPKQEIYVPEFFSQPADATEFALVVFFHGASWCAEQNFYDARKNAVLLTVNQTDPLPFSVMGQALPEILERTEQRLLDEGLVSGRISALCITSFSGGYVAVREILKVPEIVNRVTDVVLADSLYAPRIPEATDQLEPSALEPFLNYARQASTGKGHFWFSHLFPPEEQHRGNTTTLAARYLLDKLQVQMRSASDKNSRGASLLYRADKGNFHVLGYAGMTTQDHFEHFYALSDLLRLTSIPDATQ